MFFLFASLVRRGIPRVLVSALSWLCNPDPFQGHKASIHIWESLVSSVPVSLSSLSVLYTSFPEHHITYCALPEVFRQVKYGGIVDAVVLRWPDGRSRGFGYVTFSEVQGAQAALNDAHQIGGRQVDVKRAVPGTNKLFVGGLPQNTAAAELREHFEAFGTVSDAVVMIDPATNRSRGFGFVCFLPGQEGAASAAFALEQYEHHRIRGKWIEVKSAAPPHKLAKDGAASSPSAASESGGPPQLCLSSPAASPTASPLAGSPQSSTSAATPQVMSLAQALRMPLKGQSPTAGPQAQERPVASPQHRNRTVRNLGLPSKSLEPQKVMLPGAVGSPPGLGATAAAALAAMRALGSPPGLEVDEAEEGEEGLEAEDLEEAEEESAGDATPVINAASPESRLALSPTVAGRESDVEGDSHKLGERNTVDFSNSFELHRSLEQLIRLRAEGAETSSPRLLLPVDRAGVELRLPPRRLKELDMAVPYLAYCMGQPRTVAERASLLL
ncbi:Rbp6 [Symbiodinium sp. CCMP2592]|nr:Rbp6 [Symbiodinium sp. CCMP2592]